MPSENVVKGKDLRRRPWIIKFNLMKGCPRRRYDKLHFVAAVIAGKSLEMSFAVLSMNI